MEIGKQVMVTKKEFSNSIKKAKNWDGKSRPVDDAYREGYERIFGKKENDELAESYKESRRQQKERKDNEDYLKEIKNKL
jgi:hypothetical protein